MDDHADGRLRGWRRRLTFGFAAAVIMGGALVGTPLHAAATSYTLTLTASATTANAGTAVTLTATASPTPTGSFSISIDTAGSGYTAFSNPVSRAFTYPSASSHTFTATLADGQGATLATSSPVTVTWVGTTTYTLTLTASASQPAGGDAVTLTATASPNVPTNYHIDIWESPSTSGQPYVCWEFTPCTVTVTHYSGQYSYHAFLDNQQFGYSDPPAAGTELASTSPVTVQWLSTFDVYCGSPTLPILDGNIAGIETRLAVKTAGTQTAVCFRIDAGSGDVVGGALVVNAGVSPSLPTIVPGVNLCRGATGNTLPGPPVVDVSVLGQPVYVGLYSGPDSNGAILACVSVAGVTDTVVLSVGIGPQPGVTFIPDPDSLVQG